MAETGPSSDRRFASRRVRWRRQERLILRERRLLDRSSRPSPLLRVGLGAACLVIALWGVSMGAPLFIPLCLASLLALLLSPLLNRLVALRVPEPIGITTCVLVLLLPLSSVGYLVLRQIQVLIADFPRVLLTAEHTIGQTVHGELFRNILPQPIDTRALAVKAASQGGQAMQFALSALGTVLGTGSQMATVLLFTILLLASRQNLRRSAERLLAPAKSIEPSTLLDEIVDLLQQFLFARFAIVGIVGLVDAGILAAGGVRYVATLAALLGIATMIPAIGFLISFVPVLIVMTGMDLSFARVAAVTSSLIVVSIIEGNILTPRMVGRRMNINTLSVFVGLFAGGLLWGTWGMFLSIPLIGALRIALSVIPELNDWSMLLAAREDRGLALRLRRKRGPLSYER